MEPIIVNWEEFKVCKFSSMVYLKGNRYLTKKLLIRYFIFKIMFNTYTFLTLKLF